MTIIVPNVGEVAMLQKILNQQYLTLKLYSNDVIPSESDTAATYNEVVGGGYANVNLSFANWAINSDGTALYPYQDFQFTGATNSPTTVYGYYIVDASGVLLWSERFPEAVLPFVPLVDTLIRITPRIQVA